MNLNDALQQFDLIEANLNKLETTWTKMSKLIPQGVTFVGGSPQGREYQNLRRTFDTIVRAMPAIDGWSITAEPPDLDMLAQDRLDAMEVGLIEAETAVEQDVARPSVEIDEYRHRLNEKRRQLVRERIDDVVAEADAALARAVESSGVTSRDDYSDANSEHLDLFSRLFAEADRLLGAETRPDAWDRLRKHLHFAKGVDLLDINEHDWPAVRTHLRAHATADEPHRVDVVDVGQLTRARPRGHVSTALKWDALGAETFERLLYAIISSADGYENADWLMRTNAPDRARDLSVIRVRNDSLGGVKRDRVIIQCKHWLSRSVTDTDVNEALTKIRHWEPPLIAVLVIATSGRFTADAVRWIEQHNHSGARPSIEMWPESHLEHLLAQRPHLVVDFGLR